MREEWKRRQEEWVKEKIIEERLNELETKEEQMEMMIARMKQLERKDDERERRERRNNIIMKGEGIPTEGSPKEIIKQTLRQELQIEADIEDAYWIKREQGRRMLVAKLGSWQQKKEILIKKSKMKGKKLYIDNDLTKKERDVQKEITGIVRTKRERGEEVKIGYKKLIANGKTFIWEEEEGMKEINFRTHRWKDCVSWFVGELGKLARRVKTILASNVPMRDLTPEQCEELRDAARCHVCCKPFAAGDTRVRDHCHLTGRYRGPAHSTCNLNYKDSHIIPVIFHNLSGYDAHFIIEDVANAFEGSVELLPLTKERYIAFTKNVANTADRYGARTCVKLRFINSYKFLSTSLDKLTSYLDRSHMRILRAEFRHLSEKDFQLLTWKGVFPYEYVDSVKRLHETRLPPRESFHSLLTGDTVSGDNYAHATTVWNRFAIENLGQYSDMYLKTDVLLLADVFENFRDTCIRSYSLDPAHYYTLPGYTWDTMLLHTGIEFELLTDVDMGLFVERGVRGGLSQCSHRYARVNNRYVPSYDPSELSSYLIYYDVNNLYGWAMCQPLPRGEFRWVEDVSTFNVHAIPSDSPTGYILEVDLEYPRHLHDAHADLPFCPTREAPPDKRQEKLLATLCDKQRYVIHYRTLQQCTRRGLRVARIHRTLEFAQSAWLRDYIELNTAFRTRATNDFEKNLYKLMNNAVFGKTMENVRNRVDVKLVTRWEGRYGAEALISRPNFHSRSVFGENLAVELRRLKATFNRPIYVGMCILDISKTRLYEFHYDYMAPLYGDKCRIIKQTCLATKNIAICIICMDFVMAMLLQLRDNTRYDFRGDNILKDECLKPYIEGWERQVYFNHNITLVVQGIIWIERKKFSIFFLDVSIVFKQGKLGLDWFRKPTFSASKKPISWRRRCPTVLSEALNTRTYQRIPPHTYTKKRRLLSPEREGEVPPRPTTPELARLREISTLISPVKNSPQRNAGSQTHPPEIVETASQTFDGAPPHNYNPVRAQLNEQVCSFQLHWYCTSSEVELARIAKVFIGAE
ncbi:hypothetical protein DMN91_010331 [Ooceraea biroi]|uniref:DNA-directed DNA polymerase n=1 Tax=Ooceraea biroi TaxID=2015173 RepID=A0A3L8DDU8_OOCBI|nr:hypothetical protein DMN91_010331 [Ooceraea biroi]